jgi:hypothetical protein
LPAALLAWIPSSRAGLTLSLSPASQAAAPGATLVFSGLLTNTSSTDKVFLNDLQPTLTGSAADNVTLGTNTFFANVPGILLPGESYNGPLFTLLLSTSAAAANYTGSITFLGGADINAGTSLATTNFTLLATPVDQWRYNTFGSSANTVAAGDTGDWDQDHVSNLLEYALGLNAKVTDAASLPKPVIIGGYLTLSYLPAATDVTYTVQASTDLIHWGSTNVELVTVGVPAAPVVTYRYNQPVSSGAPVFLRLLISR